MRFARLWVHINPGMLLRIDSGCAVANGAIALKGTANMCLGFAGRGAMSSIIIF